MKLITGICYLQYSKGRYIWSSVKNTKINSLTTNKQAIASKDLNVSKKIPLSDLTLFFILLNYDTHFITCISVDYWNIIKKLDETYLVSWSIIGILWVLIINWVLKWDNFRHACASVFNTVSIFLPHSLLFFFYFFLLLEILEF